MKKRLIYFLAGIIFPFSLIAHRQIQYPCLTSPYEISDIHALDENNVWIEANEASGAELHPAEFSGTDDGGQTWLPGVIQTEEVQTAMSFAPTNLTFSTLNLNFGEVDQGETGSRTVTISNYGSSTINLTSIQTDNMDFYSNTPSAVLNPGQSINVEVIFQTSYIGLAEGHLIVESDHPELSYVEVSLSGTGVDMPELLTDPAEFDLNMFSGEKQFNNLTLTNTLSSDIQYSMSVSLESALPFLGWNYGSTPLDGWSGILDAAPDQAMFIKDITIPQGFGTATIYLSFDDGCRVWINGQLALDYKFEVHPIDYWNRIDDVSYYLQEGRNRISIVVFNGVYGGGGGGGFDCQLTVDGNDIIKRGDQYYGQPEAMWYYYGQTGMTLIPPVDVNRQQWWENDYGRYDWLKLARATGQQFLDLGWNYLSTPIYEDANLLNAPPDMAQFVKDVYVPDDFTNALLYLGFDDGCRVWINGKMVYDYHYDVHGVNYWDAVENVTGLLVSGRNRLAIEVYNGIWGGGAFGGFDCQLTVDDVDLIKRGDLNPGAPEAMWYMYGQGGQEFIPLEDMENNKWFAKDYAFLDQLPSNTLTGTIGVGNSENLIAVFDAAGLPQGTYLTNIQIDFDMAKMQTQIPVTLNVMDGPHCKIKPGTLDFGSVYFGHPETLKLTVSNTGSETLNVNGIFCDNMFCITADPSYFSLEPGQETEVNITYTNDYDDKYLHRNLYLESNDPLDQYKTINLMAYGEAAPDLVIENVSYMWALLSPGESVTQNLHINNWGDTESTLNFTLPQGIPMKSQSKPEVNPMMKTTVQSQTYSSTVIQRDLPKYYKADIKSHKNLVIDDVNGKSGVAGGIELFYDEMENGRGNWALENYRMTDIQWHLTAYNAYSPSISWWCGNETTGDYHNDSVVQEAIISPPVLLPPVECNITLEFHEMWDVEDGYDQCFVDISTDGGYNWDRIREGNPGSSGGWITTSLNLSQYWNQEIKIRFMFDTGDDIANDFPGWFIDDVKIYVDDFSFLSLSPSGGSIPGQTGFDVTVDFNASGYDPGYYPGFIMILSNDPDQPQYYLPAIMEVSESPQLNMKVALEGPYHFDGSVYMRADLVDVLPLNQPFNVAPWYYSGTESVPSIPNTDIVDWVLLEFRDAPDAQSATPATTVGRQAAFLRNNALVVNLDGYSRIPLNFTINQNLFVVVWHRNHLGIMNAQPIIPAGYLYEYDFTTASEKAYGIDAQKDIGNGFYGMYSGDLNADRIINSNDKNTIWKTQAGKSGYFTGDADMNKSVDNTDKNIFWLPNAGKSCQVPQ